jgi:hypothetical protein
MGIKLPESSNSLIVAGKRHRPLPPVNSSGWFGSCGYWDTLFGKFDQKSERFINRSSVRKHLGNVWVKWYQIGTLSICLEMLAPNTSREIILWAYFSFWIAVLIMIHIERKRNSSSE